MRCKKVPQSQEISAHFGCRTLLKGLISESIEMLVNVLCYAFLWLLLLTLLFGLFCKGSVSPSTQVTWKATRLEESGQKRNVFRSRQYFILTLTFT